MTVITACPACRGTGEDPTAKALEALGAVLPLRCAPCRGTGLSVVRY